jgi:heat-inducible transcriptional repressor
MELSKRHSKLLKIIIEDYAYTASPIASNDVIKKYMKNVSSATVRNDMAVLEKHGFLEKTHTSSGRIPSIEGYKYYEKNILHPTISDDVKNKLRKIFNNRELSIDTIIDQSVEILKETFKLPLMVTSNHNAEKLKRFDLIQIDKGQALIIIVTSGGEVIKNTINFNTDKQFDDIAICIRVFNDRLVDTPLTQLEEKIISLKEIIRKVVHEYEFCIRQIIEKIFNFKKISTKTNIVGTKYLTLQHEFHDINRLNQVLMFLEDTNV